MPKIKIAIILLFLSILTIPCILNAKSKVKLHPRNKQLVQLGIMPVPKYYPEIPRITAHEAYGLYLNNKALFVLISADDLHLIVGGIHLTEDKPPKMDPNRLPFQPGQVLVAY